MSLEKVVEVILKHWQFYLSYLIDSPDSKLENHGGYHF